MKTEISAHVPSRWLSDPLKKETTFASFQERYNDLSELEDLKIKFPNYSIDSFIGWLSESVGKAWLYCGDRLTYNYLNHLNQLRFAWFQYTMNDGKPVILTIVDRQIQTIGKFSNSRVSSSDVVEGIQTALLLRDKTALDYFAQIPVSFTEQAGQEDMIVEIMMAFHQLVAKGEDSSKEAQATFYHLREQFDWDTYQRYVVKEGFNQLWVWKIIFEARKQYTEYVSLPVVNIYYQIWENNRLGFEDAVRIALEKWKTYYTRTWVDENTEEQDRSLWGQGFLSLPIAAACAYAYDRGLRLEVLESSYIPHWLIEGDFSNLKLLLQEN